jgi:hypothetical protein
MSGAAPAIAVGARLPLEVSVAILKIAPRVLSDQFSVVSFY